MRLAARVAAALSGVAGAWDVTKGTPRLQWGSCPKPPRGAQQNKCHPCMTSQELGKRRANQQESPLTTELAPGNEKLSAPQDWDPRKLRNQRQGKARGDSRGNR